MKVTKLLILILETHYFRAKKKHIQAAFDLCTPREQEVLAARFQDPAGQSCDKVKGQFGVTRERIRQIQWKALLKMKGRIARLLAPPPAQPEPHPCDPMLVETLGLGVRTSNCLSNGNITTVGQLRTTSAEVLMKIKNFGRKVFQECREKLQAIGVPVPPDWK